MGCFLAPMGIGIITTVLRKKFPDKYKVNLLNYMLWGGVIMLAVEHIAHQEIVPYPPFLTAGLGVVLSEILLVGVPMTLLIIAAWALIVSLPTVIPQKALESTAN